MYAYYKIRDMKTQIAKIPSTSDSLDEIYCRPGFLVRRAHQILMGIAEQECAKLGLTPHQHVCVSVLDRCGALDQISLGKAIGMDRATAGELIRRLEMRGLVERTTSPEDNRRKLVGLTSEGRKHVAPSEEIATHITQRLLAPLNATEKKQLVTVLTKLTTALNHQSSTPVEPPTSG
jgi:DNA-binding MarR family transcriptional regulator